MLDASPVWRRRSLAVVVPDQRPRSLASDGMLQLQKRCSSNQLALLTRPRAQLRDRVTIPSAEDRPQRGIAREQLGRRPLLTISQRRHRDIGGDRVLRRNLWRIRSVENATHRAERRGCGDQDHSDDDAHCGHKRTQTRPTMSLRQCSLRSCLPARPGPADPRQPILRRQVGFVAHAKRAGSSPLGAGFRGRSSGFRRWC
jgi:hypothetical protein